MMEYGGLSSSGRRLEVSTRKLRPIEVEVGSTRPHTSITKGTRDHVLRPSSRLERLSVEIRDSAENDGRYRQQPTEPSTSFVSRTIPGPACVISK
jgi:hypothetical protein